MSRPEAQGPPEAFYDEKESRKYTQNSRIMKIQQDMAERALELLALPNNDRPRLILDLGCGSGLSGSVLAASGHFWMGMDISESMLKVGQERSEELDDKEASNSMDISANEGYSMDSADSEVSENNSDYGCDDKVEEDTDKCMGLLRGDMGEGAPFRPGTFDGCISISALQWLCHSNRSRENPKARLTRLFSTLFGSLSRGARAIFQFYPETSSQIDLILACAMKAGFTGGLVVDYPHSTRAKKYYLCLMSGPSVELPRGLDGAAEEAQHVGIDKRSRKRHRREDHRGNVKDKTWIMKKKESARKRGEQVKSDSKYTARKRRIKF